MNNIVKPRDCPAMVDKVLTRHALGICVTAAELSLFADQLQSYRYLMTARAVTTQHSYEITISVNIPKE